VLKLVVYNFFDNCKSLNLKIALVFKPKAEKATLECQRQILGFSPPHQTL
jgi:hypothetical protein